LISYWAWANGDNNRLPRAIKRAKNREFMMD